MVEFNDFQPFTSAHVGRYDGSNVKYCGQKTVVNNFGFL